MKIVLSGGTGFIGGALLRQLQETKNQVVLLTRKPEAIKKLAKDTVEIIFWDGKTMGSWAKCLDGSDAIINLAGEPIAKKRWTKEQKRRIINSRVEATKAMVTAIAETKKKPSILVNASAVGFYGNVEDEDVTESHPKGNDFVADVCEQWEREACMAEALDIRVVLPRFGVVLAKDGGAFKKMQLPFKLFVGGPLGTGRQWFSWVHREDVIGVILFALEQSKLSGPVNVVAPEPVTMKQFCKTLGKALGRPSWAPVPALVLRALLGEMAEMFLTGQRVIPKKLEELGYQFQYPKLEEALSAILSKEAN
ncbi:MAG: TIGR01777 family oxidoreductase, partial [bacterium]